MEVYYYSLTDDIIKDVTGPVDPFFTYLLFRFSDKFRDRDIVIIDVMLLSKGGGSSTHPPVSVKSHVQAPP